MVNLTFLKVSKLYIVTSNYLTITIFPQPLLAQFSRKFSTARAVSWEWRNAWGDDAEELSDMICKTWHIVPLQGSNRTGFSSERCRKTRLSTRNGDRLRKKWRGGGKRGIWKEDAFGVRCINQGLQRASNGKVESRASSVSLADSLLASSRV